LNIFYKDEDLWLGWTEQDTEIKEKTIFIHTEIYNWSLKKYKKFLIVFSSFLNSRRGETLYSITKTEKEKKFNELFGMSLYGTTKENYFVMRIEA